jgi:hypothetical protein
MLTITPPTRGQGGGDSGIASLSVHSSRPLAEMLDKVQHLYLLPISFEEVPYQSSDDLKSLAVKQIDGSTKMFLEPLIVDFSVTFEQAPASAYAAAQSVVSHYASAGLPGIYNLVQAGDQVTGVPYQVRSSTGGMLNVTPLMSSSVKFPLATHSVIDTLQLVTQSISSQTGAKVVLLNVPFQITDTVTMSATGEAARDVIAHLGKIFGLPASSQCLYEATLKTYFLNVENIFPPNPPGVPAVPGLRIPFPGPGFRSPDTMVFTK